MKRKAACAAALIMLTLALTACGGLKTGDRSEYTTNTLPGVDMTIVRVSASGATYTVSNATERELETGNEHDILIEVERNGAWYAIETGDWANTAEACVIMGGDTREFTTAWTNRYGALPKGHYRILKGCWPAESLDICLLAAEFEID